MPCTEVLAPCGELATGGVVATGVVGTAAVGGAAATGWSTGAIVGAPVEAVAPGGDGGTEPVGVAGTAAEVALLVVVVDVPATGAPPGVDTALVGTDVTSGAVAEVCTTPTLRPVTGAFARALPEAGGDVA